MTVKDSVNFIEVSPRHSSAGEDSPCEHSCQRTVHFDGESLPMLRDPTMHRAAPYNTPIPDCPIQSRIVSNMISARPPYTLLHAVPSRRKGRWTRKATRTSRRPTVLPIG